MFDSLVDLPAPFWIVVGLILVGSYQSIKGIRRAIGIPMAMVLGTVAVWYVGDALYNDYSGSYVSLFPALVLQAAWWQVVVFLGTFLTLTPFLHKWLNRKHFSRGSQIVVFFKRGLNDLYFQRSLTLLFNAAAAVWVVLQFAAVLRYQEDFIFYLFPFLGKHPGPWVTSGVGGGVNTLLALANYLQLMVGSLFGVVAALSTNPRIRRLALLGIVLTWPHYIFHRTRKFILLIVLPGALAWVFLRLRGGMLKKVSVVAVMALFLNAWFGFVISNRSSSSITDAFLNKGVDFAAASTEKHQGLNMFEELAWITQLTSSGRFSPSIGENYLANLANPIPRSLWPNKPTIGLDYAVARGLGGASTAVGVYATLSNGVVGQGVVNFGLYFGPAFAALLMGLWACWLARLDLMGHKVGYLPLFGLGLILTFNMGRDITFLELYPFVFGYMISWWLNKRLGRRRAHVRVPGAMHAPRKKEINCR